MTHPRGRSFRVSSKRQTAWNIGVGGTAVTQIVSSSEGFIGNALQPSVEGITIVRIRGLLDVYQAGAVTADGDGFWGAVGIGIASFAAVSAAIASVPTPLTDVSSENWLWHSFLSIHDGDTSALSRGPETAQRIDIDSKAMRKFATDQALYAAFEVVEIGTSGIDLFLQTRTLVKLA